MKTKGNFSFTSTCYQSGEIYTEAFATREERDQGLFNFFEREDILLTDKEFNQVLEQGYYAEGMDLVELVGV